MMALIVTFVNISKDDSEICDYDVTVYVNTKAIHTQRIIAHDRRDGWRQLVKRLGESGDGRRKENE